MTGHRPLSCMMVVVLLCALVGRMSPAAIAAEPAPPDAEAQPALASPMIAPLFGITTRDEWGIADARQKAVDAGVRWARASVSWSSIEPQPGVFNFSWLDVYFAEFNRLGIIPLVFITDNPGWASSSTCGPLDRVDRSVFAHTMGVLAERYDGDADYDGDGAADGPAMPRVDYWELYNEPDIRFTSGLIGSFGGCWGMTGGGIEYAKLLQVTWPAIHRANPNAQVVFGSIAAEIGSCPAGWDGCPLGERMFSFNPPGVTPPPFPNGDFIDEVFTYISKNPRPDTLYFDVFSFHYYTAFYWQWDWIGSGIIGKASHYRSRMLGYGIVRPIISTEGGLRSDPCKTIEGIGTMSDELQSRYVVRLFVQSMKADLKALTWFTFADTGQIDPPMGRVCNGQLVKREGWGLLSQPDFQPKPSYAAYKTLTWQLDTAAGIPETLPSYGAGSEGYVFTLPGIGYRTVIWAKTAANVYITFLGSEVYTVDKWGNARVYHDGRGGEDYDGALNGQVSLMVTGSPVYIDGRPGVAPTRTRTSLPTMTSTRTATPTFIPTPIGGWPEHMMLPIIFSSAKLPLSSESLTEAAAPVQPRMEASAPLSSGAAQASSAGNALTLVEWN